LFKKQIRISFWFGIYLAKRMVDKHNHSSNVGGTKMTLVKWNPSRLDREINNLVRTFWDDAGSSGSVKAWNPRVDIAELEDRYEVHAEVPGLSREEINVTLEDGTLTIQGEKKRSSEAKDDQVVRTERFYGKFSRSFNVGDRVDAEGISASYKDGVLVVGLPKAEQVKPRAIEVEVA
jgi:HSP20 family protein